MGLFDYPYQNKIRDWQKFEKKLQLADIIMVRTKRTWIASMIRRITGSYWDHVALVFAVPNPKLSFYNYLIIEANRTGLEVHRIQDYTKDFKHYDIGVKRVMGMDEQTRERVLAFMMNQVDQPYDISRILGFFIRSFDINVLTNFSKLFVDKNDFICSAFIQRAFYDSFPEATKSQVLFAEGLSKRKKKNVDFESLLNYVSPADIAKSDKCKWLYNQHY